MIQPMKAIKYGIPALMLAGTVATTSASKINSNIDNKSKIEVVAENQSKQDVVSVDGKDKVLKVDKEAKLQQAGFFDIYDNPMLVPLFGYLLTFGILFAATASHEMDKEKRERRAKILEDIIEKDKQAEKKARLDEIEKAKQAEEKFDNLRNYEDDLKAISITQEDIEKALAIKAKGWLKSPKEFDFLKNLSYETERKIKNLDKKFSEIMQEILKNTPSVQKEEILDQISECLQYGFYFINDSFYNSDRIKTIIETYSAEKEKLSQFRRKIEPHYDDILRQLI